MSFYTAARKFRYALVGHARLALHRPLEMFQEQRDRLLGRHDPLIPPARLMFIGGGRRNFRAVGASWLETLVRIGGVRPDEQVLDVGCGVGRMAVALTRHLSPQGSYDGFDIVPKGIAWCRQEITSRFPNFRFEHADLHNERYNPNGALKTRDYRFPYPDASFDFAFLTSVFTHMLPDDVRRYLGELRRVLKPGGRCLITWFLLDDEAKRGVASGASGPLRNFRHQAAGCWLVDPGSPEAAVGYEVDAMRALYRDAGLSIREPVLFGSWSGRTATVNPHGQDIVVATR